MSQFVCYTEKYLPKKLFFACLDFESANKARFVIPNSSSIELAWFRNP